MKKMCLLFCLAFSINAYSQNFKRFKQEGDSLRVKLKFKEALLAYDKAIDEVETNKDNASESDWLELLHVAGNIEKGNNKYWNLAYGTRSEKLDEKITFLKDIGVKYFFTYQINANFDSAPPTYLLNTCFSRTRKTLVWAMSNDVFIQAFDDCNTYKPLKIHDPELFNLLSKHYQEIVKRGLMPIQSNQRSNYEYKFEFYPNNVVFNNWLNKRFFTDPETNPVPNYSESHKKILDRESAAYNYNIHTLFYKLYVRTIEDEKIYVQKINSGQEKGKVGKME